MIFLSVPLVVLFGMLGGQVNKLFRPIGITLTLIATYLLTGHLSTWWICLPTLTYGLVLSFGYGENSKLMKWLKSDEVVRIVFSFMCCVPVWIVIALTNNYLSALGAFAIVGAFQIRMGSWGKIGKYDILPEDLFRYLAIGGAMTWALG